MYNNLYREPTQQEMANYHKVDKLMMLWQDDYADNVIECIGNYVYALREESKACYQRVYRIAKKHGLTVPMLVDWYCIEVD